jgi:hypothetical protein
MSQSIYDMLADKQLEDVTLAQLNTPTKRIYTHPDAIPFIRDVLMMQKALEASRTYCHGIVIPEQGDVTTTTVANGATANFQPSGSEVWVLQAVDGNGSVSYMLSDGASPVPISGATADPFIPSCPIYLTNSLYLVVSNASGDAVEVSLAYQKLSM